MTTLTQPASGLLRHRDFLRLWAAQTVSDFGARITREGLPMMAVMGLSASPARYPLSTHAESLATHLVYGVATDTVRRLVRRALS